MKDDIREVRLNMQGNPRGVLPARQKSQSAKLKFGIELYVLNMY